MRRRFSQIACVPTAPVYLGGSVTVRSGSQASPNPLGLKVPDAYPVYIHEVQIGFRATAASGIPPVASSNLGIQFSLGAYKITNGFIPLGCFSDLQPFVSVDTSGSGSLGYNCVWKLSKPLFVPPGAILLPTFRNVGQSTNSVTAFVQYNCSVAERVDPVVHIPFISSWTGKNMIFDNLDTDESAENDLLNDSDSPLFLDKLSGVITVIDFSQSITIDHDLQYGDASGTVGQLVQVKVRDSDDRAIVDQFTVWDVVFPYGSRAFRAPGIQISPRKYIKVYVNKRVPGLGQSGDQLQPAVAAFGHREVRL